MTQFMMLTLIILLVGGVLFATDRLREDLVALLMLVGLVVAKLVTPLEALAGFGSPVVVTIWACFVLSLGLSGPGAVHEIGRWLLQFAGKGEGWLMLGVMGTAVFLSTFMITTTAAAILLPIVLTAARQAKLPPSKLLLPMAIGCLLGSQMTLIGSPSNLLVSDALRQVGLVEFQLLDFIPVGIAIGLAVISFMLLVGRHLLPERYPVRELSSHHYDAEDTRKFYGLSENLALVTLPADSPLAGKSLADSRIGQALDLTILGLQRDGRKQMTIQPEMILEAGDQLLALGPLDRLAKVSERPYLVVGESDSKTMQLFSPETGLAELKIYPDSPLVGQSIAEIDMRRQYHFNVLAIQRGNTTHRTDLQHLPLLAGDKLLLQGNRAKLLAARLIPHFAGGLNVFVAESQTADNYRIHDRLLVIHIPPHSSLVGLSLAESNLGKLFGLIALGIIRDKKTNLAPLPDTTLQAEDTLLVEGDPKELTIVRGLQGLSVKQELQPEQIELESEMVGLAEVVLSPHTTLANKSLRDLHFRERYGLSVLAIWRNGRIFQSDLANIPLQFGDAFLLYGSREKINLFNRESDFLVLEETLPAAPRPQKASWAMLIMLGVFATAIIGWLPLSIAAMAGAAFMVLSGCLKMEEIYQQVDWRLIFLIAGMAPMGIALERSGAAQALADRLVALAGGMGTWGLLIGLFVLTSAAAHFVPNVVVTLLLAPIALKTASALHVSPYALLMVIAIAASTGFIRPSAHPVSMLIMGSGGYKSQDYMRVGVPLTLVILAVVLLILPLVWPL